MLGSQLLGPQDRCLHPVSRVWQSHPTNPCLPHCKPHITLCYCQLDLCYMLHITLRLPFHPPCHIPTQVLKEHMQHPLCTPLTWPHSSAHNLLWQHTNPMPLLLTLCKLSYQVCSLMLHIPRCTQTTNSKLGWLKLMCRPFTLAHSHRHSTHTISWTILCILGNGRKVGGLWRTRPMLPSSQILTNDG
jgi:hypothetical protein